MKPLLLFIIFWSMLLASSPSDGQALLTRNDSVRVKKDTTIHLTVKNYRGNIQWQKSPDHVVWSNLEGKTTGGKMGHLAQKLRSFHTVYKKLITK